MHAPVAQWKSRSLLSSLSQVRILPGAPCFKIMKPCDIEGKYRYYLRIHALNKKKRTLFILCNPSTADANYDDPTTRNLKKWASKNHVQALTIVNLFAYRAT